MHKQEFDFLTNPSRRISRWWLLLGVTSLAIAGLFSIVLVVARTPALAKIPFFVNLFHASIVVHVDMSMLAWFLCIACLMWSTANRTPGRSIVEQSALVSMAAGFLFLTLSPLDTAGEPLMSNYIPVIHSPVFFFGLALIGISVALMSVRTLCVIPAKAEIQFALYSTAAIALIALAAFVASFYSIPPIIDGQQYYEMLFWGGGHVLQYLHVQVLLVVWLFLITSLAPEFKISAKFFAALVLVSPIAALLTPIGYLHEVISSEHRLFFTHMMIGAGGIAPLVFALYILPYIRRTPRNALWSSLLASLILFLTGGAMGLMIEGQNVVIPAHYHGSIIGITLAFMGMVYALLPSFGYRSVLSWRLAFWQPIVYCTGQLMHISGLAISGGYGALRKTPGVSDLAMNAKIAMGFMGMGGLLAAIGGLMFVIVVIRAVFYKD